ncbi:hypothetical protein [Chloroflexus sp. Y-396-1]|uniref:hypothetical protein n=1 Tax=Chloroflexus sp. Y-396-1 TaxID=867845 RepID=UPI0004B8937A|nr:hypothetical protein [Chloroflexus sp. Y-396-1]
MFTFYLLLTVIVFILSFLSGMMGLGVVFVATPVLGLFGLDLKHEIMPLSLWLNGITAISSAITLHGKEWLIGELLFLYSY